MEVDHKAIMKFNSGIPFDEKCLCNITIELRQLDQTVKDLISHHKVTGHNEFLWALKALTLTDLTTLAGDDTFANVNRLCQRAAYPFPQYYLQNLDTETQSKIHTAAVCVYPSRVADARKSLLTIGKDSVVPIAAVATGFPTGQYPLVSRLKEIDHAINQGAKEIDIVIDRSLALTGKWREIYDEISAMRKVCGKRAHMKTILAIGELATMENVYKASMVAMMAGSDFIKTSTGKEAVNATLPVGLVMIHAIQEYEKKTNYKIGLKPAGGVRTVKDAIAWMIMIKETLGMEWLQPELFRFGASGLLDDIENVVRKAVTS